MNKGYRFNSAIALANFYSDPRNYAEFNTALALDPRYNYGQSSAQDIAASGNLQREALKGRTWGQNARRLKYRGDMAVNQAAQRGGRMSQQAMYWARKNPLLAAGIGVAGVGAGAGGAYLATRPEDNQY